MRIYIDESGTFVGAGKPPSPSIVGALVIPDHRHEALMRQYRRLRRSLPKENDEVKGRLLNEAQLLQVVTLLRSCDALFFANLIEMGLHSTEGLERHRAGGAHGLVRNLTDQIHPNIHKAFHELKARLEKLPLQLYVQGTVLNQLLAQILGEATAYWAQRRPDELGRFAWMMDAKGDAAIRALAGVVREKHEQRKRLLWTAGGGVLAGYLLWSFLPSVVVRSLPEGWHMPERMARHMVGEPTLWEAGNRIMRAVSPGAWQAIADAVEMRRDNREAIDACEQAARRDKQPVRCTIRIREPN